MSTEDDDSNSVDYRHRERWQLEQISRLERAIGISGSGGGGMDGWQQSVESRLSGLDGHILDLRSELRETRTELRNDIKDMRGELLSWFRWLLGLLVVLFGSMLGVMAKGFGWI